MLSLHAPTLSIALTLVTLGTGLLLLISWLQNRRVSSLIWWGAANIAGGIATLLFGLRGVIPNFATIDIASAILCFAFTFTWAGFRRFCGKPAPLGLILAPSLITLALLQWPTFYASVAARVVVASIIPAVVSLATARELYLIRDERLPSRVPMMAWLCLHAIVFGARAPLAMFVQTPTSTDIVQSPWFTIIMCESLLNVIATSFLQIAMIKDRAERLQREAARTDPLTGAPNRRALFADATHAMAQAAAQSQRVCALLIDIDHFKAINDRFGHGGGDAVLCGVAQVMREHLRAGDLHGRIGGEEFACLLPNTSMTAAMIVAEGLRARIAALSLTADEGAIRVSVSVGVALADQNSVDLDALLRAADRNLYEAKANGRNRISATATVTNPPQPQLRWA